MKIVDRNACEGILPRACNHWCCSLSSGYETSFYRILMLTVKRHLDREQQKSESFVSIAPIPSKEWGFEHWNNVLHSVLRGRTLVYFSWTPTKMRNMVLAYVTFQVKNDKMGTFISSVWVNSISSASWMKSCRHWKKWKRKGRQSSCPRELATPSGRLLLLKNKESQHVMKYRKLWD